MKHFLLLLAAWQLFLPATFAAAETKQAPVVLNEKIREIWQGNAQLNPDIFNDGTLKPDLRKKLIQIGNYYFNKLKNQFPDAKLVDILLTGSNAGYNYTKNSDIDVHLVINLPACDQKLLKDYLIFLSESTWHKRKITYKNRIVEVTVLPFMAESGGVYSLLQNKWLQKPLRKTSTHTQQEIKIVVEKYQNRLRQLQQAYTKNPNHFNCILFSDLQQELVAWRTRGIKAEGTAATANLGFRVLRDLGMMDAIDSLLAACEEKHLQAIIQE
ncbi:MULTISPECIES: hypothetical protein [Legionella]|uniref:Nucleotidyltransferase domain-containing protein n=1 Tax=Legionella septentrionalis TaxID=2498109 RepID=A0A3S0V6P0_9GAMM|nr:MULTISPECIES: hypothetical protein [Legionella]MCP0913130.1 hypothetical protein [Legionella sp. 27cVA30]RUQ91579.1 hypothetical protein EKM59_00530 [Legionella septentrionalis]RUR10629.1 hypothetical protein ELY14_04760 [Legionella septentrionalis]RUR17142.1 hypothetical protein ELY10_01990 [Legionella septentrionalis]